MDDEYHIPYWEEVIPEDYKKSKYYIPTLKERDEQRETSD